MIRRLKKDVLSELPKKSRKIVELNLKKEQLDELQEYKNESTFIQLWQKTGIAKLNALRTFISSEIKKGTKFLLFAHHIAVMDGMEEELIKVHFHFNINFFFRAKLITLELMEVQK